MDHLINNNQKIIRHESKNNETKNQQ